MKKLQLSLLLLVFLFNASIFGQENYELLYLRGDVESILSVSSQKRDATDYYWHALVERDRGGVLASIEIMEKALTLYPEDEKLERLLANVYYETGNYIKAKPLLQKYSGSVDMFLKVIEVLEFENNFILAINLLETRMESDSLVVPFIIHLGDNYFQVDSLKRAATYYQKVFDMNPNDQSTANKLAGIRMKLKQYKESIEICDVILENDSLNRKFIRTKGSASFNNKDFSTARECFSKLLVLEDSGVFVLKHLGISEFHTNQFRDSRNHLVAAFKKNPDDFEVCYVLGKGYLNSPTPIKGIYYFERADSLLQPDSLVISSIYLEKQSIYSSVGMYDEALYSFIKAYSYDSKPKYLFFIASLYENRFNDSGKALEYYSRFLEMLPPQEEKDYHNLEEQTIISLRGIAERSVEELREKLFFEGKLEK